MNRLGKPKLKKTWPGWLFVAPFLIGFFTYYVWVIVDSIRYSFSSVDLMNGITIEFLGWDNYDYVWNYHPTFKRVMIETIISMLGDIPVILIFSLFVAVVLNSAIPGKGFFRSVFFIPVVVSVGLLETVDAGNLVMGSLSSSSIDTGAVQGAMNYADITVILQNLQLSPTLITTLTDTVENIMTILNHSGVQIIIFLVGLQSISSSVYESAKVAGASEWVIFWKITFPMISPLLMVNLFFSVIDALTRSNNAVMNLIRAQGIASKFIGQSSAMAWLYFTVVAVILAVGAMICQRYVFHTNRED